jgi:hypothetical protein
MGDKLELVENDNKPSYTFTVTDEDDVAIDLTGSTVNFYFKKMGAAALKNAGHTACVGVDLPNGIVRYDWANDDLDTPGLYEGELEVTYADTTVQTIIDTWQIRVRPEVEV